MIKQEKQQNKYKKDWEKLWSININRNRNKDKDRNSKSKDNNKRSELSNRYKWERDLWEVVIK